MNLLATFTALAIGILVLTSADRGEAANPACPSLALAQAVLPIGIDGTAYSHTIPAFGGQPPVNQMVTGGSLPPGISLSANGTLSGTPTASGVFSFVVTVTDSCRGAVQQATQRMNLQVLPQGSDPAAATPSVIVEKPLRLTVSVTPASLSLAAIPGKGQQITYRLTAQPPATATFDSPGGTFSAAGIVLASLPAPLTAIFINGVATLDETVTVPQQVIKQALRDGATKIIFSRPFIGHGTTALAVVEFTLTPVQGENPGKGGEAPQKR